MRATIVKLLVFLAVTGSMTAYLAMTIGNIHPFRDEYDLVATFDDVTGLLPDDNVKIAGVVVGKVNDIDVKAGRALVRFEVDKDVRVPSDSEAVIRWRSLLGQRYLYLVPGEASTVLRDGDNVERTRSVVDLGELFNRLGPIVKAIEPGKVNDFLTAVVAALDGNEAQVRKAIDDLAALTAALAERDQAIARLIENLDVVAGTITSRDQQIRVVLDNLLALATTFNENTAVLDAAVTDLGNVSNDMAHLLTTNRDEIDRIVDNLTALIEVVRAKVPTLDDTVARLDEASAAIFRSASYGEFLNQEVLCIHVGGARAGSTPCNTGLAKPGGDGGTAKGATRGRVAIRQLVTGGGL